MDFNIAEEKHDLERKLRVLIKHAWDSEVEWATIEGWLQNFNGKCLPQDDEQLYALFALTRFMYFGKKLTKEMLRSLYRDCFQAGVVQFIRQSLGNTSDIGLLSQHYDDALSRTRFVAVGNPSESGAHLLYYFRQVNELSKSLFIDIAALFRVEHDEVSGRSHLEIDNNIIDRYVFFDDLVGSGDQAANYLSRYISAIRRLRPKTELRYICLFATNSGLQRLNCPDLFNGCASCLFELDDSYKMYFPESRYFMKAPQWFDKNKLALIMDLYGSSIYSKLARGYKNGQLMLAFSHNTPDNVPIAYWARLPHWKPVFERFHKVY